MFGLFKKTPTTKTVQEIEKVEPENPYFGREPIIDRDQAIIGFELFFRPGVTLKAKRINERNIALAEIQAKLERDPNAVVSYPDEVTDADLIDDDGNIVKEATLNEIINSLRYQGIGKSLGNHLGFFKIHMNQLSEDLLRRIPATKFPLQISLTELLHAIDSEPEEEVEIGEGAETSNSASGETLDNLAHAKMSATLQRLERFRKTGYKFVLTDLTHIVDGLEDILPMFRYVKLDLHKTTDPAGLIEFCKSISPPIPANRKVNPKKVESVKKSIQIIATEVHTPEDFRKALHLGCDAFEGFYFTKRDPELSLGRGDEYKNILKLLTLLLSSPALPELVKALEANPLVAKRLMVFAENVSSYKRQKDDKLTLTAATNLVGVKRITRWAQLILYADPTEKIALESTPLLQLVTARAFFMELASAKLPAGEGLGSSDLAFMVGCLSLIDNVFDENSRELLSKFNLPYAVIDAISDRSGMLGQLLSLSEAAEMGDLEKCQELCTGDLESLSLEDVTEGSIDAIKSFVALTQIARVDDVWGEVDDTEAQNLRVAPSRRK